MSVDYAQAAADLDNALRNNELFPASWSKRFDLDEGYEVQFHLLQRRLAGGEELAGWKVGLTALAMQQQQGVHEPCLGHLLASGHTLSPAQLDFEALIDPGFENELCLRVGRQLGGDVTPEEALAAIEAVAPALEIVEKRGDFGGDLPLAIAGNAQQHSFVTGNLVPMADGVDLAKVELTLEVNGEVREQATGAEVLGSPVNSVVWLAGALSSYGRQLEPGDLVMSGSFTKQYPVSQGDEVRASFSSFGTAQVSF